MKQVMTQAEIKYLLIKALDESFRDWARFQNPPQPPSVIFREII